MSWINNNGLIYNMRGDMICRMQSNNDRFYSELILSTHSIWDIIIDFFSTFENRRTLLKSTFDNLESQIRNYDHYISTWSFNTNYGIENEKGELICVLPNANPIDARTIKSIPEVISLTKELLENFRNRTAKQSHIYKRFCDIQEYISG